MRLSASLVVACAVAIAAAVVLGGMLPRDPVERGEHPELEASVLAVVTDAWQRDAIEPLPSEVRCRAAAGGYLCDVLSPAGVAVNLRVELDGSCWTAGVAGFDGIRALEPGQGPQFSGCL